MTAREFGDRLLRRLLTHVVETVPGAAGAGLSLVEEGPGGRTGRSVAAAGVAVELDPQQWASGTGPLWQALGDGPVVLPGGPVEPGATGSGSAGSGCGSGYGSAAGAGVRGLVAVPGEWGGPAPLVFSVYFREPPDADDVEQVDRFEAVAATALAVVEHCAGEELRAEQMVQMMQYRRVIEQAKGLVMAALGVDAGSAFATLARASQHFNVRLRNLAVALVEHVGRSPAERPEDPDQVVEPSPQDRRVAAQVWAALSPSTAGPTADPAGPADGSGVSA